MLLAIDAGNTNTVFAIHDGRSVRPQWRLSTSDARTADEYAVWLSMLMELQSLSSKDIDQAIIASVVPQTVFNLKRLCIDHFGVEPLTVGDPGFELGFDVRISHPSSVGADRLANTVGAHTKYGGALIVVDFGTATNFDVINEDGAYEGGVIAPGVNLSLEALHMAAARLPLIAISRPDKVVGHDTESAMQSGVYWGYVGLIEGLIDRIKTERSQSMTVIGTGGLADLYRKAVPAIDHIDQDLTIQGLVELNKRNRKTAATAAKKKN